MRTFTIDAIALLFVFIGVHQFAQANEVKAKIENRKGEAKVDAQEAKGEAKALMEEAKGNKGEGHDGTGKGKNESSWRENQRHREGTESQDRVN